MMDDPKVGNIVGPPGPLNDKGFPDWKKAAEEMGDRRRPWEPSAKAVPSIDYFVSPARPGERVPAMVRIEVHGSIQPEHMQELSKVGREMKAHVADDATFRLRGWHVKRDHDNPDDEGARYTYCTYVRCNGAGRPGTKDRVASRAELRELAGDAEGKPTGLPEGWVLVAENGGAPRPFCSWKHASLYSASRDRTQAR